MMLAPLLARIGVFGAIGIALGALHFLSLRRNVELYVAQRPRRAVAVHALRMVLVVAAWLVIARFGAAALLAAFAGLLGARMAIVARAARRA